MSENKSSRKEGKDIVISTRLTESEYTEILCKISDGSGKPLMKPGAYLRAAATGASITVVDAEIERYRAFIAGKISNNLNQITRRLNEDNKSGKIDHETYGQVLAELKELNAEFCRLLVPLS
jgi:hypothetical protein